MRALWFGGAALVAAVILNLAGCQKIQYKVVAQLPPPVFSDTWDRKDPTDTVVVRPPVRQPGPGPIQQPIQQPPQPGLVRAPDAKWEEHAADNAWKYIIIHHSATSSGNATRFDREHKAKGWDELGYHFVIGNGTNSNDGQVEVGSRWVKQKHGAHCKTRDERYNDFGIGVCLVGNFETSRPSSAQWASMVQLVTYLADRYKIPASNILGHSEAVNLLREGGTKCPGRYMEMDAVRQAIRARRVAFGG